MSEASRPSFSQLVLASGNAGKLAELQAMLGNAVEVIPQSRFVEQEVEETGLTFVENAILKARHAARASGLPSLADDSGLAVDALGGAPGIYSARYAGGGGDSANNAKLLEALQGIPDDQRSARFISVLVLMLHAEDPTPIICEGVWHGRILHAPQGSQGFGYDPLFWVLETGCASAELSPADKNRFSHRAQAMADLRKRLGLV
jgi:XTP/dITP diphosphohydrolase